MSELLIMGARSGGRLRVEVLVGEEQEFDFWISEENAREVLSDLHELLEETTAPAPPDNSAEESDFIEGAGFVVPHDVR